MTVDTSTTGRGRSDAPEAATVVEGRGNAPASADDEALETRVGRYAVLSELGRGGMGRVLRAYDPKLQREVALKVMRSHVLDPSSERRMIAEARAMAQLAHPNVVAVYDVEELADGRVALAMEYVAGQTLSAWLRTPRAWHEVVACFVHAGRGLAAAHAAGLLHRDFKPANVLVADDGLVKVTDFGLAKPDTTDSGGAPPSAADGDEDDSENKAPDLTAPGIVMGTPRYMAPEQHQGKPLTAAADQYAFCVALWGALTGAAPFDERALAHAKVKGPPPWPGGATPRRIADAIVRGLAPDPGRRWPSVYALLAELDADPGRRRRQWLFAALGLGTVASAVIGVQVWAKARAHTCAPEGAAAHLEDAWGATRRDAVREAMRGVDAVYADDTWRRTEAVLDGYAADWRRMHVEACEATTIRGEQSAAAMDLRMTCLHRARVRLAAITEVLSAADETTLRKAHDLVGSLPPLNRCADVEALSADVEPPPPREASVVAAVDELLAAASAARTAGRYDEARRLLDTAYERLDGIEYEPIHLSAILEEAYVRAQAGEYARAETLLRDGLARAARGGHWVAMQEASTVLISLVGGWTKQGDAVSPYVDLGIGLGNLDPELGARAHNNLALVLLGQGRSAESEAESRIAIALKREYLNPDDPGFASSRSNLANALDTLGRHEEAEAELRQVIASTEKALGRKHPSLGLAHNNLGLCLWNQDELEEAATELRRAIEIKEATLGPDHPELATSLGNLGGVLLALGRYAEAEVMFRRGIAIAEKGFGPDNARTANGYANLGLLLDAAGRHDDAEVEHRRALQIREKTLPPDDPNLAQSWKNVAGIHTRKGEHAQAQALLRRALAAWEGRLGPDAHHVAAGQAALASSLHAQGKTTEARALAETAWKRCQRDDIVAEQASRTAFTLAKIRWDSEDAADRESARSLARRALEIAGPAKGDRGGFQAEVTRWLEEREGAATPAIGRN